VIIVEVQPVIETQTITIDVNVVDGNATTRSKTIEEHVFKNREPRKVRMLPTRRKKNS